MLGLLFTLGFRVSNSYESVPSPSRGAQECLNDFKNDNEKTLGFLKLEFVRVIIVPLILIVGLTVESFMRQPIVEETKFKHNMKELLLTLMVGLYFISYFVLGFVGKQLNDLRDEVQSNTTSVQNGLCSPDENDLGVTNTSSTMILAMVGVALSIVAFICLNQKKRDYFGYTQMFIVVVLIAVTLTASSLYKGAVSKSIYTPEEEQKYDRHQRHGNKLAFFAFTEFVMPLVSLGMLVTYAVVTEITIGQGTFASMREFI